MALTSVAINCSQRRGQVAGSLPERPGCRAQPMPSHAWFQQLFIWSHSPLHKHTGVWSQAQYEIHSQHGQHAEEVQDQPSEHEVHQIGAATV